MNIRRTWIPVAALASALALVAPTVASGGTPSTSTPLVPRSLSSLAAAPNTILELERSRAREAAPILRAAGAVEISHRFSIWRVRAAVARRLIPRFASAGWLREFESDRVVASSGSLTTAGGGLPPETWWRARVGVDRATPPGPNAAGIPVTVIDTGLDLEHPLFKGRPNTKGLNDQWPDYWEDHGTAVSSLIVGVYPNVMLYSWDAGNLTLGTLVAGLDKAAALGRGVVNLSLGTELRSPLLDDVVLDAYDRGLVIVASAGNSREDGSPNHFPANTPHVLTIAATNDNDQPTEFSTVSLGVDLSAPGDEIYVAVDGDYDFWSGTSFSAPIVSGAAAWLWTARPDLDKTQVIQILRRSARDLIGPGRDPDTGFGMLDIPTALNYPTPVADPSEPNDDVTQVVAGGMFPKAKPQLTAPGRPAADVEGRLDSFEDPEDVYRVWIPAGKRLTATVTTTDRVNLELWRPGTRSVHDGGWLRSRYLASASPSTAAGKRTVTTVNRGAGGAYYYLDAYVPAGTVLNEASYSLSVTTGPAKGQYHR